MNTRKQIVDLLNRQSRIGRRVCLLLAYIKEHPDNTQDQVAKVLPGGLRGEFKLALRMHYITRCMECQLALTPKGRDVILWLTGNRDKPKHWREWEDRALCKQLQLREIS